MRQSDVPIYDDPTDFEEGNASYPCSTQFMVYNALQHRYYLTEQAINFYGINIDKYITDSNNPLTDLIIKATKKIYEYIQWKSGFNLAPTQFYRIATAPTTICSSQYQFRKDFEQVLKYEAEWLVTNGDSAKYSTQNMANPQKPLAPNEEYRDTSDIAPESIRILEGYGLTRWFTTHTYSKLDESKY
jgi:hypothetical protein